LDENPGQSLDAANTGAGPAGFISRFVSNWLRGIPRSGVRSFHVHGGQLNPVTFAEHFCAINNLPPERYTEEVLRRSLYPAARILQPVLGLNPGYFESDVEFVSCVGRIKRLRDFDQEAYAYIQYPKNRTFLRRHLKLRASVGRLQALVHRTLRTGSRQPFSVGS
jgi:hypothetical protein